MGRKKRTAMMDDYDDFEEGREGMDVGGGQSEIPPVMLRDFVVPEKVAAFVRSYAPCCEGDDDYEQFDDGRLREVFKAYVCNLGDPLALYIEDLKMAGFRMDVSLATGEPCIFARRKCSL